MKPARKQVPLSALGQEQAFRNVQVMSALLTSMLKLSFEIAQSTVAKYMVRRHEPSSQGWRTFLRNCGASFQGKASLSRRANKSIAAMSGAWLPPLTTQRFYLIM